MQDPAGNWQNSGGYASGYPRLGWEYGILDLFNNPDSKKDLAVNCANLVFDKNH
jgi:hypothetical protein